VKRKTSSIRNKMGKEEESIADAKGVRPRFQSSNGTEGSLKRRSKNKERGDMAEKHSRCLYRVDGTLELKEEWPVTE